MRTEPPFRFSAIADSLGIAASAACAVHCMIGPALLIVGATIPASFLTDEAFHSAALWLILPAAVLAFGLGCRRHKDRLVLLLGAVGLVGIVLAGVGLLDVVGESGEIAVTLASAALLITAHVRNFKLCRADHCDHSEA